MIGGLRHPQGLAMSSETSLNMQRALDRLRGGDAAARDELLGFARNRLERLARKMIADFRGVQRWEQADDVLQNAAMRLYRALQDVIPENPRGFFRPAATQIRRELLTCPATTTGRRGWGSTTIALCFAATIRDGRSRSIPRRIARLIPAGSPPGPSFTPLSRSCRTMNARLSNCSGTRG